MKGLDALLRAIATGIRDPLTFLLWAVGIAMICAAIRGPASDCSGPRLVALEREVAALKARPR